MLHVPNTYQDDQGRPLADRADCLQSAPRRRGPHATPTNLRKLTLSIESACVVPAQRSRAVSATSRFGDGTFRPWWSQMYYAKKCVFLKYFEG